MAFEKNCILKINQYYIVAEVLWRRCKSYPKINSLLIHEIFEANQRILPAKTNVSHHSFKKRIYLVFHV